MDKITIDGVAYEMDALTDTARQTVRSLQFVQERLQQRRNELAVADTARMAYERALKRSLPPQA